MINEQRKEPVMRPAICTQCGGQVEVDAQGEKAICPYCGMHFFVAKAINTFNVQHATIEHVDSITIKKKGTVESVLNYVLEQQKRADEERKEEERKQREAEERQREEEARQREEERRKKERDDKYWWVYLIAMVIIMIPLYFSSLKAERNRIPINYSSSELVGANYQDVVAKLQENGFTDIKTEAKKDIVFGLLAKDGEVERVEISGDDAFESGATFSKDADITVIYHTYRWEKDRNATPSPVTPGD